LLKLVGCKNTLPQSGLTLLRSGCFRLHRRNAGLGVDDSRSSLSVKKLYFFAFAAETPYLCWRKFVQKQLFVTTYIHNTFSFYTTPASITLALKLPPPLPFYWKSGVCKLIVRFLASRYFPQNLTNHSAASLHFILKIRLLRVRFISLCVASYIFPKPYRSLCGVFRYAQSCSALPKATSPRAGELAATGGKQLPTVKTCQQNRNLP
jgi:hypothetical protein